MNQSQDSFSGAVRELTSVKKNGVLVESDVYSPNGERVKMIQGSSNTNVVYTFDQSQYNILYEKNLTSSTVIKNYYADGLQLAEVVGGSMYYLIDDALGSVRAVTTPSPVTTVFSSNYRPYGENYGLSESLSVLNFEYTHKPYDSSTGLYYYGARFYDPSISRFITEDSSQYSSIQNPLTLNRYAYVTNNPETLNDPSGHYVNYCPGTSDCPAGGSGGSSGNGSGNPNNNPPQNPSSSGTSLQQFVIGWAWNHLSDIVGLIFDFIFTVIGWVAMQWEQPITAAALGVVSSLLDAGFTGWGFLGALATGDIAGLVHGVVDATGSVWNTFVNSLSIWNDIEFSAESGAVIGLGDAATAGAYSELTAMSGYAMMSIDAGYLIGSFVGDWQIYNSS